ncbi:MICOS complex subunit Mic10-like isoform X1 [Rhodnius prolixus]|uniref:MICOS complex subunit Mic10-like isoform X1 n=1 Tax=Rhodnius prolixus TaxID=13249 RepID=UPI003D18A73E
MSRPIFAEDVLNWCWNRCVNDALIKSVAAGSLGYIGSKFFFSRTKKTFFGSTWPIYLGVGVALGMAWYNCEREFQLALKTPCEMTQKKVQYDINSASWDD